MDRSFKTTGAVQVNCIRRQRCADRAGFLVANDLELAEEMIKAADEASAALPHKERMKELILYSVSEEYFGVRQRLGINIDG